MYNSHEKIMPKMPYASLNNGPIKLFNTIELIITLNVSFKKEYGIERSSSIYNKLIKVSKIYL